MTSTTHINEAPNLSASASIKSGQIALHHLRHSLDLLLGGLRFSRLSVTKLPGESGVCKKKRPRSAITCKQIHRHGKVVLPCHENENTPVFAHVRLSTKMEPHKYVLRSWLHRNTGVILNSCRASIEDYISSWLVKSRNNKQGNCFNLSFYCLSLLEGLQWLLLLL